MSGSSTQAALTDDAPGLSAQSVICFNDEQVAKALLLLNELSFPLQEIREVMSVS